MTEERDEGGGFRVTDRRRFTEGGEPRDAATDEARTEAPAEGRATAPGAGADEADAPDAVTFVSFVLGLSTQALVHLGEVERPAGEEAELDLPAAKHFIDILGLLQVKTHGNLAADEAGLLDAVLYDLRMRYVDLAGRGRPDSGKEPT